MTKNNVISILQRSKHDFDVKHWYWAVWIDVVDHKILGDQLVTASGFEVSKSAAKSAAWSAIIERVSAKEDRRAFIKSWAWELIDRERQSDTRPMFSRCSLGKNKWQWVVGDFETTTATGIAESPEAAQRDAEQQVGPVRQIGNWLANSYRTEQLAIERSQKTTDSESALTIELIYECHRYSGDFHDSDSINPHRIVKRTKTRIYVDCEPYRENVTPRGDWTDYLQRTFVLDRAEFESKGMADRRRRGWGSDTFYSHPDLYFAERRSMSRSECFVVRGVQADATEADVKKAFKVLAKKVHPDAGGDPEEFKAVYAAYERAMAIVSSHA